VEEDPAIRDHNTTDGKIDDLTRGKRKVKVNAKSSETIYQKEKINRIHHSIESDGKRPKRTCRSQKENPVIKSA